MIRATGGPSDGARHGSVGGRRDRGVPGRRGGGGEDWRGVALGLDARGSQSSVRGEPLLQWMDPQVPTSILFSLDDATESIEWESLNERISAMLEVLNQARGILRDIIVPTGRVST